MRGFTVPNAQADAHLQPCQLVATLIYSDQIINSRVAEHQRGHLDQPASRVTAAEDARPSRWPDRGSWAALACS